MFHFPAYPPHPTARWPSMTMAGFPHSETLGSKPARRLPEAYRCPQRPSSALSAKASTIRPCRQHHPTPQGPEASARIDTANSWTTNHHTNDHKTIKKRNRKPERDQPVLLSGKITAETTPTRGCLRSRPLSSSQTTTHQPQTTQGQPSRDAATGPGTPTHANTRAGGDPGAQKHAHTPEEPLRP